MTPDLSAAIDLYGCMIPMEFRRQSRSSRAPNLWGRSIACWALIGCLGVACGCSSTKKHDNPVVGPRPPRLSDELLAEMREEDGQRYEAASDAVTSQENRIMPAGGAIDGLRAVETALLQESASGIQESDVAARVNGRPIFVSEVLEPYQGFFLTQGKQLSEAELSDARKQIIERDLDQYIEQAVILDAARSQFKQEQWEDLQIRLDEIFYADEIANLKSKLDVGSLPEVEAKLQEMGSSLSAYRRVWGERQIAGQWVSEKIPDVTVSRQDLLDEYDARVDDYREPEQVKWQQCLISISESGGREQARNRVQQAIQDLKAGQSFDDVVEKHSDVGGGLRDWTQTSSLADERLRETLTTLKINQLGPVLEDDRGFRLVKLVGYRPEQVKAFEEVQADLRESISQRRRSEAAQKIIDELRSDALIETILDERPASL